MVKIELDDEFRKDFPGLCENGIRIEHDFCMWFPDHDIHEYCRDNIWIVYALNKAVEASDNHVEARKMRDRVGRFLGVGDYDG